MNSSKSDLPSLKGMRLLFLTTYPPPYGGIASHLKNLMPSLLENGAEDIAVITFDNKDCIENHDGITVYRYSLKKNFWRVFLPKNIKVFWQVFRTLLMKNFSLSFFAQELVKAIITHQIANEHRSQVVISYIANQSYYLIPLEKVWKGEKEIVLAVFGCLFEHWNFMSANMDLVHKVLDLPKFVFSSSQHCANSFKKIGINRLIEPVFFGVELEGITSQEKREQFRSAQRINDSEVVVFFMGRMVTDMGLDVVLQIAPSLLKSEPSVRLLIAGATGSLTKNAEDLSKEYPEHIIVLENVSFSDQSNLYSAADILVAPSFNQRACMGVSIKEAMAACLPVIGANGGGIPEAVIDGETGYLIPLGTKGAVDSKVFLERVRMLVSDSELRSRLGSAGRLRAEQLFSVKQTNKRITEILLSARESTK
jgi:glycosyltransferase involved in cell wall biosynthesis